MINSISWASYLYAISIILVIYYVVVLILYFRNDLLDYFVASKARLNRSSTPQNTEVHNSGTQKSEPNFKTEDEKDSIQELFSNIQSIVKTAASRNFPKEELLLSLQLRLKHQDGLNDSTLRGIINNNIIEACEHHCSIHLTEEEINALWNK